MKKHNLIGASITLLAATAFCSCITFAEASASASSSASGSITVSGNVTVTMDGEESEITETATAESSNEQTWKAELYDKYSDLITVLEEGKYQDAIDKIQNMMPEAKEGQTELTLENWSDYFLIKEEEIKTSDAYGAVEGVSKQFNLTLRPEYENKKVELEGVIGIIYEMGQYRVSSIDPENGTFELEAADGDGFRFFSDDLKNEQSKSIDLSDGGLEYFLETSRTAGIAGSSWTNGFQVSIKGSEKYDEQCVLMPENFQVVRVEGSIKVEDW